MARISTSSSLPRPTRYFGSASGRRCSTTPMTRTPAVRHSSFSSSTRPAIGISTAAPRLCLTSTITSSARSRPSVATADGATRSNSSSSASIIAAASSVVRWNGSLGSTRQGGPPSIGGNRWATWRSAVRPSGVTPTAATRSRRRSARSTRSSRVSGSLRRCVCTRRRPRKRPRPARMRPISGRLMREASPTKTCSMSPRRLASTPTCRSISRDTVQR